MSQIKREQPQDKKADASSHDKIKYYLARNLGRGPIPMPIKAKVIEEREDDKVRYGENIIFIEPKEFAIKWPRGFFTGALYKDQFTEISKDDYEISLLSLGRE